MALKSPWGKPVVSDGFMLGLIGLATTPLFPAPDWFPSLSLDSLTGRAVYIGGWIALSLGFFLMRGKENADAAQDMADIKGSLAEARKEIAAHGVQQQEIHQLAVGIKETLRGQIQEAVERYVRAESKTEEQTLALEHLYGVLAQVTDTLGR